MDDTQIEMLPMLGEFSSIASQYEHIMFYYESGIQQIVAKLQILNNEFKNNHERNPIENIKSRVKSLDSIIDKMKRKGIPLTTNAMKREIKDIAGVRVICPFISDVYQVANMLVNQADVEIVTIKDYIKKPKENGYRSLHMIVLVDVYFSDHKDKVPIEIQFRTIAMNFWASTEHQLRYKKSRIFTEEMQQELYNKNQASGNVSKPGYSEHQTGLALNVNLFYSKYSEEFTGEGDYAWVDEHCAEYGFIPRYQASKESETGIGAETGHYLSLIHISEPTRPY